MSSPGSTLWMLPCLQRGMFRQTPRTLCSDIIIVLIKAHIAAIIPLLLPAFDIFRWHLITWCPRGRQQRSRRSPIPPPWNTPDPARSEIVSTKPTDLFVNQSVCLSVLGHRHYYINQLIPCKDLYQSLIRITPDFSDRASWWLKI